MEDKISANNLFHFTPKSEYLESIIHNGFYPRYCLESPPYTTMLEAAFPMVCFCDIPFYLQSEHINEYGEYGIGLSMAWGLNYGLSPLIYSSENSKSTTLLKDLFELPKRLQIDQDPKKMSVFLAALARLSVFYKPYIGSQNGRRKKFYNEREWRYSPPINEEDPRFFLKKEGFDKHEIRESFNQLIAMDEKAVLNFQISDVEYLILPKKAKKDEFFKRLSESKSRRSKDELNQLTNKKIVFSEDIIRAN